jgi:carbon monoxide dehydrogenase subunit G
MRLDRSFVVPVAAPRAWAALTDAPSEEPLVPGVAFGQRIGDRFAGTLRVKVGPVALCYRGSGRYVVKDPSALRFLVEAAGQDVHGGGTAAATVSGTLRENPDHTTRVSMSVELAVTGPLMQSNRRLMQAAGDRALSQFAEALVARVAQDPEAIRPARCTGLARLAASWRTALPYAGAFLLGGLLTLVVFVVLG